VPRPKPDAFLPLKSNWFHILICRYYKLTPLGRQVLDLESQRLKDLVRVLDVRRRQEARS
jgi:hypothetical protein